MPEFKMLDEVIHYCTRCKLDLNHRILRVEEGVPKRVLCLTCKTDRMYRSKIPAARRAATGRANAARATLEAGWLEKLNAGTKTPKPYSMDGIYKVDDIVEHKLFGLGINTELVPPNKVQVFFQDGMKLLQCGNYK